MAKRAKNDFEDVLAVISFLTVSRQALLE